jgi:L-fuconolactonase
MVIDSHQHFWKYQAAEYGWLDESMATIRRDFLPENLSESIKAAGIDGVISVQARQSLQETHWLLRLADENDFIRGVIGWAPLTSEYVGDDLRAAAADPKFRGVCHGLKTETDDQFMLRDDFNRGISLLSESGLAYDLLIHDRQLPQTLRFVDRHPNQVFILDHLAKPKIKSGELEPWDRYIVELGKRPNVYCKISGMVTEADWQSWTEQGLRPYFNVALEAFGPKRLMAGSDWPVCLVACGYTRWFDILRQWAAALSKSEQDRLFGETAAEAYRLK